MINFILSFSLCPQCKKGKLILEQNQLRCTGCGSSFFFAGGKPVLLSPANEIFPPYKYQGEPVGKSRAKWTSKLIPSPSVNLSYRENLRSFAKALKPFGTAHVLVVGSGQQKPLLAKYFSNYPEIRLLYCDIDRQALIDFYCDAQEIPFQDGSFQGVIITAVLEHILDPGKAVGEISRVLTEGGIVYSEVPFMQQVHAGAYDFTRFSLSGHRRLFRDFEELSAAVVAGPATALVWAIEHFALAFVGGKTARALTKAITRLLFFWLKYFDYLFRKRPQAFDGASCTYFLGQKGSKLRADKEIIEEYPGAG